MQASQTYDVIIVGTGAGGGTLLHELASTGKRILALERGGYLPKEPENWDSRAVFVDNKYKAEETWLDRNGRRFRPEIHYYVGGNTKLYGAALLRFQSRDFEEVRHYGGISPAWPIHYEDIEPYYTKAENLYQVHGERGIDPLEPESSGPYPYPALRHEPRIQELESDLRRVGCSPFPLPVGIMLDEERPQESRCIRCLTCDGYPCMIHAKADAETVCVQPALEHPNVTLLTHARVTRLETDVSGREVTRVVVERNGEREAYQGDIVVLSCGAVNSAALMLQSKSEAHPRGLANSSDLVGRNYMCHNNSAFVSFSPKLNSSTYPKTLALNDFYFGSKDWEFPLGHIQTMGKADAEKFRAAAPVPLPRALLEAISVRSLDFWLTSEDLPSAGNRVLVEDDGEIRLHYRENNVEGHNRLVAALKRLLRQIGPRSGPLPLVLNLSKKIRLSGTTHQCGTLRFGRDPKASVLDVSCKAHDLDNLYVVDGSFFPSSAAMNPALTIFANALRVAEHLKDRLG